MPTKPTPPQSAINKDRPVNTLLKMQMEHLHVAEKRLPLRHHTDIYVNAIKTEGEAAEYIRRVTEAIHAAHAEAAAKRARKGVISIAAEADEGAERKRGKKKGKDKGKS